MKDPARIDLDNLVITMELTLLSIIQGVALYWLTDSSKGVLVERQWQALPYIVSALLILLLFWSWSMFHTFTIIRWPLEFTHNFGYIAATLLEALMFTRVSDPLAWFVMGAAYSLLNWFLFARDFRMIRRREAERNSPTSQQLLALCERGQLFMTRAVMPGTLAFYILSAAAIAAFPAVMLDQGGNLLLAAAQVVGGVVAIVYVVRLFGRAAPLILQERREPQP